MPPRSPKANKFDKLLDDYQRQIDALGGLPRPKILEGMVPAGKAPAPAKPQPAEAPAAEAPEPQAPEPKPAPQPKPAPEPKPPRPEAKAPAPAAPEVKPPAAQEAPVPVKSKPAPLKPISLEARPKKVEGPFVVPLPARKRSLDPLLQDQPALLSRLLLGAAAVGVALWLVWTLLPKAPVSGWPLDAPEPVGLLLHDGQAITYSKSRKELVTIDPSTGRTVRAEHVPDSLLTGMCPGENSLWSVDGWEHKIFQHRLGDYAVVRDYPSPGPKPSAVFWDAPFLWTIDQELGKIYQHRLQEGALSVVFSGPLDLEKPVALGRLGDDLWILDSASKSIVRYQLLPPGPGREIHSLLKKDRASLAPLLGGAASPAGFFLEKNRVWLITENPAQLRRLSLGDISFKPL